MNNEQLISEIVDLAGSIHSFAWHGQTIPETANLLVVQSELKRIYFEMFNSEDCPARNTASAS